jgi:adenine-specific DNA-methyltransferase
VEPLGLQTEYLPPERDDRYNQFVENTDAHHSKWTIITLTKAYAAEKGLPEKDARAHIRANPDDLDQFVIRRAEQVIRFARPSYEGVSAEARQLIDESKRNKSAILRLERRGYPDIFLKGGERILFYSDKLKNIDGKLMAGEPLTTLWDDILSNNLHAEGGVEFPKGKKPEGLIKRVLELSTREGDWVLDSFAGSGTTGSVAHKMGRRWIMVELGEHCHTHIIPRMRRVINGQDKSGVTEAVGWKGGGGFRFYKLAPSLLEKDKWGNWVINKEYNKQ